MIEMKKQRTEKEKGKRKKVEKEKLSSKSINDTKTTALFLKENSSSGALTQMFNQA